MDTSMSNQNTIETSVSTFLPSLLLRPNVGSSSSSTSHAVRLAAPFHSPGASIPCPLLIQPFQCPKTEPPPQPSAHALLASNPYVPTSALAQATMAASRRLSELVVVREWLHETAPRPPRPDTSTGYWCFTKQRVTQGHWTGNTGRAAENVVREMDPDTVVREAEIGHSLAGDDAVRSGFNLRRVLGLISPPFCYHQSYDKALSHTLFACVRAGNIDGVGKLCRDAHQPWRAASIRGSLLFSWPSICALSRFCLV